MVSAELAADLSASQDGLIKCICNLCQCGRHNCSSYQLQRQPSLVDNRCPTSSSMSAPPEHAAGGQCCCLRELADERYLTTPEGSRTSRLPSRAKSVAARRNLLSPDNGEPAGHDHYLDNDELMHVLITKPQVASKPRDNIIFEGDMDLRTTFETTYEALAKMRLECWKKYQEGAGRKCDCSSSSSGAVAPKEDPKQVSFNQEAAGGSHEPPTRPPASHLQQQKAAEAPGRQDAAETGAAKASSETGAHQLHPPPTGLAPVEPQRAASVVAPAQPPSTGYVDPDLASIMVYNSNLDRLEKVSCRKRNKHRPLTSLRPGARGFFGDQPDAAVSPTQQQVNSNDQQAQGGSPSRGPQSIKQQQPEQPLMATSAADPSEQQQSLASQASAQQQQQQSIKLNARNLTSSSQPQCSLVYSDENLPVDSKRKVRNNVNMIDHIRDQNIIESHYSAKAALGPTTSGYQHREPSGRPDEEQLSRQPEEQPLHQQHTNTRPQSQAQSLSAVELLLARQEEAEALDEIKKLTSPATKVQATAAKLPEVAQKLPQSEAAEAVDATRCAENDSCLLGLKRTCQNQNFYISDNEYTTNLGTHTSDTHWPVQQQFYNHNTITPTSIRVGSQYHNLFRESPDFIMATGVFGDLIGVDPDLIPHSHSQTNLNSESRGDVDLALKKEVDPQSSMGDTKEADCYLNDDQPPINNCKVEALNDSYHYVGTREGHKYFSQNNK